MHNPLSSSFWMLLCLLLPLSAAAQFSMQDDETPRFEWSGKLETEFRNDFKTDTDGGDRFESWQVAVAGEFGGPINESILVGIKTGYRYANYDFNLDNAPPADYGSSELPYDPWGAISTFDIAPNTNILVGDRFSVDVAVPIRWAGEPGARRNAFSAGISAIARWQITDELRIGAGIGVTSQLEDSAETFPIVSLNWDISDSWTFQTEGSWFQGGNAALLWGPSKAVRIVLSAGYERIRFRLDDNGPRADRDGIGEITAVPIELGLRFHLYEGAYFDFRLGLGVAGQLRVEDNDGNKLYNEDYDPSPRIALGLSLPFNLP